MKMETKKGEVAILTPDKIDFETKAITRDKESPAIPFLGIYPK